MPWLTHLGARRKGALGLVLAAALLATAAPSEGADRGAARTSSLSWIRLPGAERCVSTQDLARDVEQRLGHPIFVSPSEADVSVEGHIEPNRATLTALVQYLAEQGLIAAPMPIDDLFVPTFGQD